MHTTSASCCLAQERKRIMKRDEHSNQLVTRRPSGKHAPSSFYVTKLQMIIFVFAFICSSNVVSSQQAVNSSSELNYENLGLISIPKASLCDPANGQSAINLVSLSHNQIRHLDAESFVCVSTNLRILILRNNLIDTIHADAFLGLEQVQVLLLDDNHLRQIPSAQSLMPLRSLRHLNLANNRIETLEDSSFGQAGGNLLSLNLKGNPLRQVSSDSLLALSRLTTLILSQTKLSSPLGLTLNGLKELKYLHLDRLANLTVVQENLCQSSRKLATLVLKSNHLAEVPHLKHCQSLLLIVGPASWRVQETSSLWKRSSFERVFTLQTQDFNVLLATQLATTNKREGQWPCRQVAKWIGGLGQMIEHSEDETLWFLERANPASISDLSYNKIRGQLTARSFSNHPNLIDLYLGHNQLELIEESAFVGLTKLQVLELNNNKLKFIHKRAFLSLQSTLYDLNIAHNPQLESLPSEGLEDSLVVLKAYGNNRLREFPHLKRATSLALTYAYHCCDYLADSISPGTSQQGYVLPNVIPDSRTIDSELEAETRSLIERFAQFLHLKLQHIFETDSSGSNLVAEPEAEDRWLEANGQHGPVDQLGARRGNGRGSDSSDIKSLNELILWPSSSSKSSTSIVSNDVNGGKGAQKLNQIFKRELISEADGVDDDVSFSENSDEQEMDLATLAAGSANGDNYKLHANNATQREAIVSTREREEEDGHREEMDLIDELVAGVKQIRFSHNVNFDEHIRNASEASGDGNKRERRQRRELIKLEVEHNIRLERKRRQQLGPKFYRRNSRHLRQTIISSVVAKILSSEQEHLRNRNKRSTMNQASGSLAKSQVRCQPKPSALLPCKDLFDTWWLRVGIWSAFILAFCGNIIVIIVLGTVRPSSSTSALTSIMWLAHSKRHIDVPRFLVLNLAIADLLMALYLGLLAFVDLNTLGNFKSFAIKWQYSSGCKLAGFLGVLSSELSVFILAIITLERNYAITNAVHLNRRLSLQKAMIIMIFGYAFALTMAILPLNGISDYRKFSVCLPLDIESNLSSQLYVITLVGMNTFSFILLISCYLRMYCAIRGSQAWNTNDIKIAKRMSILVITDFLCWMPIIVVAIAFLFGHYIVGTNGMKILTIFILPLNSVANPFLYAITTKKFKCDLNLLVRRMDHLMSRYYCFKRSDNKFDDHIHHNFHYKEPNILAGGRQQYHQNMMLNKKRQQKLLLARGVVGGGGVGVGNRDPEQCARQKRFASSKQRTPITANQVTLNRTTCSCQRLFQQQQQAQSQVQVNIDNNVVIDEVQILNDHPRIVLDSVDPPPVDMITLDLLNHKTIPEQSPSNNSDLGQHGSEASQVPNRGSYLLTSAAVTSHPSHYLFDSRFPFDPELLRPRSADEDNNTRQANVVQLGPNLSCQAILIHKTSGLHSPTSRQLDVLEDNPIDDRSASACGYRDSIKLKGNQGKLVRDAKKQVAGSCDEPFKLLTARSSTDKLSRSINRLLFEPVAKAWSSIQISLSNSQNYNNSNVNNRAAYACHLDEYDTYDEETKHEVESMEEDNDDNIDNDVKNNIEEQLDDDIISICQACSPIAAQGMERELTLDDILLMSSPDQRPMRISEQRMSRSCDQVTSGAQVQAGDKMSVHSVSSSGNDPTSQFDHHDDCRTLLAKSTISTSRKTPDPSARLSHNDTEKISASKQYLRRGRCTRCRSWSPALLGKLEDRIHQIRSRIPGLGSNDCCIESEAEVENSGERSSQQQKTERKEEDSDERSTELEQIN